MMETNERFCWFFVIITMSFNVILWESHIATMADTFKRIGSYVYLMG